MLNLPNAHDFKTAYMLTSDWLRAWHDMFKERFQSTWKLLTFYL